MKRMYVGLMSFIIFNCGQNPSGTDASIDSGQADANVELDAGVIDSGSNDAGADAGNQDAGGDGGYPDAGSPDASVFDAGTSDAGADAGSPDASVSDAGSTDAGVDGGFDAGGPCLLPTGTGMPFRLRAMAANLTSGNGQSYLNPGPGQRIVAGLQPDIVMIQEFNTQANTPTDFQSLVDAMSSLDAGFQYSRGSGQIPNGIISRWPIVMSGEWLDPQVGNRTFAYAKIDLPGGRDLWAISVHFLTSSSSERSLEARALLSRVQMNIPSYDFILLGGDFNTNSRAEQTFFDLRPTFVSTTGPFPADQSGNQGTNTNRDKPYDHVFASSCLHVNQVPVQVGANSFPGGLVVDTQVYMPISDLAPALATDSAASMMQHMGVVRDYLIAQ